MMDNWCQAMYCYYKIILVPCNLGYAMICDYHLMAFRFRLGYKLFISLERLCVFCKILYLLLVHKYLKNIITLLFHSVIHLFF